MTDENMGFNPSFLAEVEVDKDDVWKGDALGRKAFAKPLTDLVSGAKNAPFCIAVDGEWGSGKTFFLKRWCVEFSKPGKAIYFNAWEDDFHADPLTAIIGQLWGAIKDGTWEEICNLWKEKCKTIIKKKTFEYVGLDQNDLQTPSEKEVKEYLDTRQNISMLKERLEKLANATQEKTGSPLVVVVDELDRCRPTFAIELLERVKHVVGVPGIVFVFGINQKGLEKSIQSVYGKIDARDYLRRFFDVGMTLPKAKASNYCRYLINHKIAEAIAESRVHRRKYGALEWESDWNSVIEHMPTMVDYIGLSLRQVEQVVRMLSVVLRSKEIAKEPRVSHLEGRLAVFVLLRVKNRDLYERFINGNCVAKEAMDGMLHFLSWENVRKDGADEHAESCIAIIASAFYLLCATGEYNNFIEELEQMHESKKELSQEWHYVPQKIAEMQDDDMRKKLINRLLRIIKHLADTQYYRRHLSLQTIAQFLEWGDYWRE